MTAAAAWRRSETLSAEFWRGFPALLLAFALAQVAPQIDLAVLARLDPGAVPAYVLLVRMAVVETVCTMALGAAVSVAAGAAVRAGAAEPEILRSLWIAAGLGSAFLAIGLLLYPLAVPWAAGSQQVGLAAAAGDALPWFAAAAPLRTIGGTAAFLLHALGKGAALIRWKLAELPARYGLLLLCTGPLGERFAGALAACFAASLFLNAVTVAWMTGILLRSAGGRGALREGLRIPPRDWIWQRLQSAGWEIQRLMSLQLLAPITLLLFSIAPPGEDGEGRLAAYAAGSTLAMAVFAPFVAYLRFLGMRLAGRSVADIGRLSRELTVWAVPTAAVAGLFLIAGGGWLGRAVYGQAGVWWTTLILALALSLPLRVVGNLLRAAVQATGGAAGGFAAVARIDGVLAWGFGLPLTAAGLWLDRPVLAYAALVLPEVAATLWLWSRLRSMSVTDGLHRKASG